VSSRSSYTVFLTVPGIDVIAAERRDDQRVLNDLGPSVGREKERAALRDAFSAPEDPSVVLVTGPGGRGKTRLLIDVLLKVQRTAPGVPVLWLSRGRSIDENALAELPAGPAIIVVDDVHGSPEAVSPLLEYARRVPRIRLVFSSRPSAVDAVIATMIRHDVPFDRILKVPVGELTLAEARGLVSSLVGDMQLIGGVAKYLVDQAMHSPYVAVIGVNLIRRGVLAAPLLVDDGFRREILDRYEAQASGAIEGVDERAVRRLLAAHAALGSSGAGDVMLKRRMAAFAGLEYSDLLRVEESLEDRGVLISRGGLNRLVPDILADYVLEREAVAGGHDTGFVDELWQAFAHDFGIQLIPVLAELDWRLARRAGPSVFRPIGADLVVSLRATDLDGLRTALARLQELAYTQPSFMIELLEGIRNRLVTSSESDVETREGATPDLKAKGRNVPRPDVESVIRLLPPLYGDCAKTEPQLLEEALDALWDLCRRDPRDPRQHPDHPKRVIADQLANLRAGREGSFPTRIVARVRLWLSQERKQNEFATPLFALEPLLTKEGTEFIPKDEGSLSMGAYLVAPSRVRALRDEIRDLLSDLGRGIDLRLAGEAVTLLGAALHQVHGFFGRSASSAQITVWEQDDLASVEKLAQIVSATSSAALRRLVREQVSWLAYHARSLDLRHAALHLITELDDRAEDDLAEVLLNAWGSHDPSRRGLRCPTLLELQAAIEAEAEHDARLTQIERDAARDAALRVTVETMQHENRERGQRVVAELVAIYEPEALVDVLCCVSTEVEEVKPGSVPGVFVIFSGIAQTAPQLAGRVVQAVAATEGSALDKQLSILIRAWLDQDHSKAVNWLESLPEMRREVRLAAANSFMQYGLIIDGSLDATHQLGLRDPDPEIRDTFLVAFHPQFAAKPAAVVDQLLEEGISPPAAIRALDMASSHFGYEWGSNLSEVDALAALKFIDHAGLGEWNVQQIVSGIASQQPLLVLDYLLRLQQTRSLPNEIEGLAEAFAPNSEVLAVWLYNHRAEPEAPSLVLELVTDSQMTIELAQRLAASVNSLMGSDLVRFAQLFNGLSMWPFRHPSLARRLLNRASEVADSDALVKVLAAGLQVRSYGWAGGVSDELENAKTLALEAAVSEPDSELKALFEQAIIDIDRHREMIYRENQLEDES
jgi:hypothetical protein